jgi:hypothetical protein
VIILARLDARKATAAATFSASTGWPSGTSSRS